MSNSKTSNKIQLQVATKWNKIYQQNGDTQVADVLLENSFLLPEHGTALDLASGLGANALFLAEKGLHVEAWDISSIALKKLHLQVTVRKLNLCVRQHYIESGSLLKNCFDVIIISRFLDRSLSHEIMESLKPGGLLFYQTYVRDKISQNGPKNHDFLLARNELLSLFQPLRVVVYRENSRIGNLAQGNRNEAFFIGQKE